MQPSASIQLRMSPPKFGRAFRPISTAQTFVRPSVRPKPFRKSESGPRQFHGFGLASHTKVVPGILSIHDGTPSEANRVFELLFDNVAEERFAVSSDQRAYFERVLRRASEKELRETVRKTTAARDACAESVGKEEGEFVSGEKLKEKLELLKKLQKHIGAHVVDAGAIKEAERLLSAVRREQTRRGVLLDLLRPALPALAIAMPANVFAQGLQSVYYQIGRWNYIGEAAAAGDVAASLYSKLLSGTGGRGT